MPLRIGDRLSHGLGNQCAICFVRTRKIQSLEVITQGWRDSEDPARRIRDMHAVFDEIPFPST